MANKLEIAPYTVAERAEKEKQDQAMDDQDLVSPSAAKKRRNDFTSQSQDSGLNYDDPEEGRPVKRSRVEDKNSRRDLRSGGARRTYDEGDPESDQGRFSPRRKRRDSSFDRDSQFASGRDQQSREYNEGRQSFETRRSSIHGPDGNTRDERLKAGVSQEDRKRGKRLFGGLLSTLSQTSSRTSQLRKRQEPADRQSNRGSRRPAEDDRRRAERMERLATKRKVQQVKFDEQVMESRHANLLALAQNLQTKSRPRLYYRPYELTVEQKRTIEEQIRVAEETIEQEKEAFTRDKESRLVALGLRATGPQIPPGHADESDEKREDIMDDKPVPKLATAGKTSGADGIKVDSTTTAPPAAEGKQGDDSQKDNHDDHKHRHDHDERDRDIMVETEEDTVIY